MRSRIERAAIVLALCAAAAHAAPGGHHYAGWSKSEAERMVGTKVRALRSQLSWGPVMVNADGNDGVPKPVGRGVAPGAEGRVVGVDRNEAGSYSVIVEWGKPEFSSVYKKAVAWRSWIDRSHFTSAVVEISRPDTPPVKPGRH